MTTSAVLTVSTAVADMVTVSVLEIVPVVGVVSVPTVLPAVTVMS